MKKLISIIVLLLVITSQGFSQKTGKTNDRLKINDVHCHYVDFVQNTDSINNLLKHMDSADVENIVLFGLSVTKLWTDFDKERPIYYDDNDAPVYYYGFTDVIVAEAIKKLSPDQQDRIYPMICGFNPVDKNGLDHIKRMVEMYPDFWVGIGEVFFRHDDLTRMTYGRNPTANCVSMDPVYEYAAEKNLPIWIHSDIADPMSKKLTFLYEMEEALKKHPDTKIVWCHIGDTRRMKTPGLADTIPYRPELADITRRLLNTYPCLYYDISWVVYEQIIVPDSTGIPSPEWIQVFKDFPDRFMVGSDKIGDFSDYENTIRKYDVLFDALPADTAQMIAYDNLFEILNKKCKKDK